MASYIKTLKEDNGDITYPQTLGSAVLLTGGADLETELAGKASAASVAGKIDIGDVQSSDIVSEAVTTAKIADGAVTEAKIDSTFIDELFYKPGDVIESERIAMGVATFSGALTGGNQYLHMAIPVAKSLANISTATINAMQGPVRGGTGGYLNNMNTDYSDIVPKCSSMTVTVNKDSNLIHAVFIRSSGWGGTNNATYSMQAQYYKITLS